MRETRYDKINGFIWHDKGTPLPGNDVHMLAKSDLEFRCTAGTEEDARKAFVSFARAHGANAALNSRVEEVRGGRGRTGYACFGTPALYARPDPEGSFSDEEIRSSFRQPENPDTAETEKTVGFSTYLTVSFFAAVVFLILLALSPVRTLCASPLIFALAYVRRRSRDAESVSEEKPVRFECRAGSDSTMYEEPRRFFILEENEPLPRGFEVLAMGEHVAYGEHKNSVDARRALQSYARECGANALLEVRTKYCHYGCWYYECYGIPAVVGKRNRKGTLTREQLVRNFYAPEQEPSTWQKFEKFARERERREIEYAYATKFLYRFTALLVIAVSAWIWFDDSRGIPMNVSFEDYFGKYLDIF